MEVQQGGIHIYKNSLTECNERNLNNFFFFMYSTIINFLRKKIYIN